jgi:diamine N-acetyltransferase
MVVTLREITRNNWRHCIQLDPGSQGKNFIPSNLYALAESKFTPSFIPLGIYAGNKMIGFVMYDSKPQTDGSYKIYSIMVDARYQRKGYGTEALRLILARLRQLPHCTLVSLTYERANEQAIRLYQRFGFQEMAETPTGGILAHLHITKENTSPQLT